MDAATLGAVGTIVVGLAAAGAALIGQRGANLSARSGAILTGYDTLVNNLQEERDRLQSKLTENERLLAAAYAELSLERANKAELQAQIAGLNNEITTLRQRIAELGGQPM
ncbi:hypothetical protein [Streptomyces sp. DH37]|uniref:hypothetical protein n=1 Tax=Streptomyces sp. DH37 TaxID=3040122 RepID=UPI0024420CFE|nr:hypothetical protein [Streptomyces sp. DH37]MDG9703829.1 hypothetical protein [Streptomyces sp. DH37]